MVSRLLCIGMLYTPAWRAIHTSEVIPFTQFLIRLNLKTLLINYPFLRTSFNLFSLTSSCFNILPILSPLIFILYLYTAFLNSFIIFMLLWEEFVWYGFSQSRLFFSVVQLSDSRQPLWLFFYVLNRDSVEYTSLFNFCHCLPLTCTL